MKKIVIIAMLLPLLAVAQVNPADAMVEIDFSLDAVIAGGPFCYTMQLRPLFN